LHGERTDEISGRLARHFEAAGMMTKAVDYLLQAGRRAVRLAANEEAVALFNHALELLASLPASPQRDRREFILRSALYAPLTATQGYACPQVASSNARAHELGLRLDEERELIPALISLAGLYSFRAEFQRATALARRALTLAEQDGAPGHVVWAAQVLGMTAMYQGHLLAAQQHLERTLAFDRTYHEAMVPVRGRDPEVVYRSFGAWVLWFLGYADQAAQLGQEALQLAEDVDHPPSLAMALQVGNIIPRLLRREYALVPELVESLENVTAGHKLGLSEPGIRLARGRVNVRDGAPQAGIREMQQGLAAWRATGTKAWASLYLGVLADAYLEAGQLEQARHALEDAFHAVQESDERMIEPELHRLWGELLLRQDDEEEAEAAFRQAIDLARRQQARSWELRAAIDLSRLSHRQGRTKDARRLLKRVYGSFSEGFDTPDLRVARALLESTRSPERRSGS
jgi:predicted ATPase